LLLGLDGVHVEDVDRRDGLLIVTVSSPAAPTGCPSCGVVATGRGRRRRVLHDVPGVTRVRIVWRQRVWRCDEVGCVRRTFVEQLPGLVARRGSITTRAVGWAIGQLRREHATVHGIARQLGTSWKTVWRAVEPEPSLHRLERLDTATRGESTGEHGAHGRTAEAEAHWSVHCAGTLVECDGQHRSRGLRAAEPPQTFGREPRRVC
jgi:transposase